MCVVCACLPDVCHMSPVHALHGAWHITLAQSARRCVGRLLGCRFRLCCQADLSACWQTGRRDVPWAGSPAKALLRRPVKSCAGACLQVRALGACSSELVFDASLVSRRMPHPAAHRLTGWQIGWAFVAIGLCPYQAAVVLAERLRSGDVFCSVCACSS